MNAVNEVNRIQQLEDELARKTKSAMFWCDMAAYFESELDARLDIKNHIINTLNRTNPETAAHVYLSEQKRRRAEYVAGAVRAARESTRLFISAVIGKEI